MKDSYTRDPYAPLTMSVADMRREYLTAKDGSKQIGVMADLQCTTAVRIGWLLCRAGEKVAATRLPTASEAAQERITRWLLMPEAQEALELRRANHPDKPEPDDMPQPFSAAVPDPSGVRLTLTVQEAELLRDMVREHIEGVLAQGGASFEELLDAFALYYKFAGGGSK